MDARSA